MRQPNSHLVAALDPDSETLEHQHEAFSSISKNMPIVCINEEKPTGVGMVGVSSFSLSKLTQPRSFPRSPQSWTGSMYLNNAPGQRSTPPSTSACNSAYPAPLHPHPSRAQKPPHALSAPPPGLHTQTIRPNQTQIRNHTMAHPFPATSASGPQAERKAPKPILRGSD